MKRFFKWLAIVFVGLAALITIAAVALMLTGRGRLETAPAVTAAPVAVANDAEAIERGRYLATISSCTECHGAQLEGNVFVDEAPIGYIPAANLTTGAGGVGGNYTDADWELAIRHGVNAAGQTMVIMPSNHFARYSDDDLADLIAFLKSAPPVDNDLGQRAIQFPGNIIFGVLAFDSWSVSTIDHAAVGGDGPAVAPTAEYGEYLVNITSCNSCHAENLAGNYGQLDSPLGPNLTGLPETWSAEDFATALQTGMLPDGTQMSDEMPWAAYSLMSEEEVQALWEYLSSLEQLPNN
ncbi:MAG: c-type cytochrome [Ardenticatenaceae bacterium]|nr:c-type cytochrome [Ardenticatenaceae bacterium]